MKTALPKLYAAILLAGTALLAGCERPPIESVQRGFRGLGMVEFYNPRILAEQGPANAVPEALPKSEPGGPKASAVYKNVKVLTDVDVGEFTRTMLAITSWVAPQQGCAYCHDGANFESDALYTKVVARRMLQMTRQINNGWSAHVAATGVTCYTCHRGQPVPSKVWYTAKDLTPNYLGNKDGQNVPTMDVALAALPADPFSVFLQQKNTVRVAAPAALPAGYVKSIRDTEATYGLMMHFSNALGVNCTYCHNAHSFGDWTGSPPQRPLGWYGIRMVRELNNTFLEPLGSVLPASRKGPNGDAPKASCATCHQGAYKPLYGAAMAKSYPALGTPTAAVAAAPVVAAPAVAAAPAPVPAPAAAAESGPLGRIFFDTGKTAVGAEGLKVVEQVARQVKANANQVVDVSGFADKRGNPDANLELAKQRAIAVRNALASAGVPENRIKLTKPEFSVAGAAADSRRVDIVSE